MHWQLRPRSFAVLVVIIIVLAFVPETAARGFHSTTGSSVNTSTGLGTGTSTSGYVVYGDALASGWYDQSWDARVNYQYARSTYSGRAAISYEATAAWAGLDMRSDTGVNGGSYGQITFALKASRNNQKYALYLRDLNGNALSQPVSLDTYGGQPVSSRWKTYSIPLANLGAENATIGHVVLHEWSGSAQPSVYLDQIQFSVNGTGQRTSASPTPLATPSPTPFPTPSATPSPTPSPTPTSTIAPVPAPIAQPIASSGLIWSADTETGNLNQWTQGQYGEAVFNSGTGSVTVSHDVAHSGTSSLKMTISGANGSAQAARIFRWNDPNGNALPDSAYYSVWYYFPRNYAPAQWWNVLQFKSKSSSGSVDPMWVLNVVNRSNGNMYFYLWDAMHRTSYAAASPVDLPVGRWVHIETYFHRSTASSGQITIWQDGVKLFDLKGIQTTLYDNQQWSLANYTDNISPADTVIYADDAVISKDYVP